MIETKKFWTQKEQDIEKAREMWNGRAEKFDRNTTKEPSKEWDSFEFLKKKGLDFKDMSVLDVGCGAGRFLIRFAPEAKEVIGIDISPEMIKRANAHIENMNFKNAKAMVLLWQEQDLEKAGFVKKFDLVFANMTPAINNEETLMKMCDASKKYCFMSSFTKRSSSIENALAKDVLKRELKQSDVSKIYSSFNTLWLNGYFPEITYHDSDWEDEMDWAEAESWYTSVAVNEEEKEAIRKYLKSIEKDGKILNKTHSTVAWMFWEV